MTRQKRILVADPHPAVSKMLCAVLAHAGYDPVAVDTADDAVAALDRRRVLAVVASDGMFTEEAGRRLRVRLRAESRERRLPILVRVGEDSEIMDNLMALGEIQGVFLHGDFLLKPFLETLEAEILRSRTPGGGGGIPPHASASADAVWAS